MIWFLVEFETSIRYSFSKTSNSTRPLDSYIILMLFACFIQITHETILLPILMIVL
jgi:hypothetical protein